MPQASGGAAWGNGKAKRRRDRRAQRPDWSSERVSSDTRDPLQKISAPAWGLSVNNRDVLGGWGSQRRGLWPGVLGRRGLRQIGVAIPGGGINGTAFERELDVGQQRLEEAGTDAVAMTFLLKAKQVGRTAHLKGIEEVLLKWTPQRMTQQILQIHVFGLVAARFRRLGNCGAVDRREGKPRQHCFCCLRRNK